MSGSRRGHYDVVVLGAGLAGLSLARHLLLQTDKTVLALDRLPSVPTHRQKVGESSVQVAGHYFSKILEMEEYLFLEHFMKYNLRFYWRGANAENKNLEDFSQAYIRNFSNVPSYQLDRNRFEAELLRCCVADPRLHFECGVTDIETELQDDSDGLDSPHHQVSYRANGEKHSATATWVVDATGRGHYLGRSLGLFRPNTIDHGASFLWVDGLVNIDKLTDSSPAEIRLRPERAMTGHLPLWLATNHFMGEGLWFWVIPLQGKTSLGLVFDNQVVPFERVSSAEKLISWVLEEFPLFDRDLPQRQVLDFGALRSFSHGCTQTINSNKWALTGESGRFLDPLYSPGSDFIAFHNTLIVDAIETEDAEALRSKCRLYEQVMKALYEGFVPSYDTSYDTLGDQEAFSMKYVWELTVYFSFYVFPFLNDLMTDRRFLVTYLNRFSKLGAVNRGLQKVLSDYYQWKKHRIDAPSAPIFYDFTSHHPLQRAEKSFYRIGVSVEEAREELDQLLDNALELARFLYAYVESVVAGDDRMLRSRQLVETIDLNDLNFDENAILERCRSLASAGAEDDPYEWKLDPEAMQAFRTTHRGVEATQAS